MSGILTFVGIAVILPLYFTDIFATIDTTIVYKKAPIDIFMIKLYADDLKRFNIPHKNGQLLNFFVVHLIIMFQYFNKIRLPVLDIFIKVRRNLWKFHTKLAKLLKFSSAQKYAIKKF